MKNLKPIIIKTLSYIVVGLAFYFIVNTFLKIDISKITGIFSWQWFLYLSAFAILYSSTTLIRAFNWVKIIEFTAGKNPIQNKLRPIYLKTEIAKYIPSNVIHFAGRFILAKKLGYSNSSMILSNVLDQGYILITAVIIVFISIITRIIPSPKEIIAILKWEKLVIIGIIITILLGIFLYKKGSELLEKSKNFLKLERIIPLVALVFLYIPIFLISGTIVYFLFYMLVQFDHSLISYLFIVSVFSLAWLSGFIVPGAPGGLGVREAVIILLFSPKFGEANSLIIGLLFRIISLCGDILAFIYGYILSRGDNLEMKSDIDEEPPL